MIDEDAHYAYGYETSGGAGWIGAVILLFVVLYAVF